jgi:LuxR family maltose regulon positive regulatory protein
VTEDRHVPAPAHRPDSSSAFLAAVAGGDELAVENAARRHWFELIGECSATAASALRGMADAALARRPLLDMLAGLCALETGDDPERGMRRIGRAVAAAQDERAELMAIDRALILWAESTRRRRGGSDEQANRAAHAALEHALVAAARVQSLPLAALFTHIGVSLHYAGEVDLALEAFSAGQTAAPATPDPAGATELASRAAAFAYEGDVPLATRYLEQARAMGDAISPAGAVNQWVAASMIELERFDSAGILVRLDAIDMQVPFEHQIAVCAVAAMARMMEGDAAAALASLEARIRSIELHTGRAVPSSSVAIARSMLQLSLGNVRVASAIVENDFSPGPSREVARSRIELMRGHPGSALRRLAELPTDRLPLRTAAEASALEAATLLRRSRSSRADATVDYLGALLARTGMRMPLAFLPRADFDRVVTALRAAGHGDLLRGMHARSVLPDVASTTPLTARERTVLRALLDSGSATEIARELYVSPNTVKSQLRSIYRKLGTANRQEAIMLAVERQLLEPRAEDGPDDGSSR